MAVSRLLDAEMTRVEEQKGMSCSCGTERYEVDMVLSCRSGFNPLKVCACCGIALYGMVAIETVPAVNVALGMYCKRRRCGVQLPEDYIRDRGHRS